MSKIIDIDSINLEEIRQSVTEQFCTLIQIISDTQNFMNNANSILTELLSENVIYLENNWHKTRSKNQCEEMIQNIIIKNGIIMDTIRILFNDKIIPWQIGINYAIQALHSFNIVIEQLDLTMTKLATISRKAGMADVAKSVIHNIGNILNSTKVSITLLDEIMKENQCNKIEKITAMLKNHRKELSQYITTDEKGKLIPEYLCSLTESLEEKQKKINQELHNLKDNIIDIEQIITNQRDLTNSPNILTEKIYLPDIINHAVRLCNKHLERLNIQIIMQFKDSFYINIDKSKLLQILVNLILNAKEAMVDVEYYHKPTKKIEIITNKINDMISISVCDNGIGIADEHINKIFSSGFSTKEKGHGIGLHHSAMVAEELGGSLKVQGKGLGNGATFILSLPINPL